jgi:protein-tyrosine phosphatase
MGFNRACATPHRRTSLFPDSRDVIPGRFEELKAAASGEGIDLDLSLGAEYFFGNDFTGDFEHGGVTRLGGENRYFLLEFQSFSLQEFNKNLFFKLSLKGLVPVIAHPERNDLSSRPAMEMFDYLVGNGALVQCDLLSLVEQFGWGRHAMDRTFSFIDHGRVAAFATDIHCTPREIELLPKAIEALRARAGDDGVQRFLCDNPRAILDGRRPRKPLA